MKTKHKNNIIILALSIMGALIGWLYWRFVGCLGDSCPIWSNPWIATGYGLLLGYLISSLFPKKKKSDSFNEESNTQNNTGSSNA